LKREIVRSVQAPSIFAKLNLDAFAVREDRNRHCELHAVSAFQTKPLTNIGSSGLEATKHRAPSETATVRIEPAGGCGKDFNFSRFREIGDVESRREVTRGALRRPVGIDRDMQRFDVVGSVFGEGKRREEKKRDNGQEQAPRTPIGVRI
jgi:hypothetical protein